jgi:HAD superfamily hydrolase (TIGR01509 family)
LSLKVLFIDLDGTLADSMRSLYEVYLHFLRAYGFVGTRQEFQELTGPSLEEIIKILKERYQLKPEELELKSKYRSLFKMMYETQILPFQHAREALILLRQGGISLYLVTSAEKELALLFLRQHQLESFFEKVIAEEEGLPGKPDPALYLKALKEADVASVESLAIEDSEKGIEAARRAGINVIRFNPEKKVTLILPEFDNWLQMTNYLRETYGLPNT